MDAGIYGAPSMRLFLPNKVKPLALQTLDSILNVEMVKDKTGEEIAKVSLPGWMSLTWLNRGRSGGLQLTLALFHSALDGAFLHQGHHLRRHPCEFETAAAASHICCSVSVCLRSFDGFKRG